MTAPLPSACAISGFDGAVTVGIMRSSPGQASPVGFPHPGGGPAGRTFFDGGGLPLDLSSARVLPVEEAVKLAAWKLLPLIARRVARIVLLNF